MIHCSSLGYDDVYHEAEIARKAEMQSQHLPLISFKLPSSSLSSCSNVSCALANGVFRCV